MNRRFARAFAATCIVAAIGAAASVAYRVFSEDAGGRAAARADFELLKSVLAYVKTPSDLADPGLRARLASRYEANPKLLLVDVYERGAGDRWRIPADSPYLPSLKTEGAVPQPSYPPSSTVLLSAPLKGDSEGKMAVDALYTSLTQITAFEAFRDALIGLAAFLALATLVLAVVSGSDAARSPLAADGPVGEDGDTADEREESAGGRRAAARAAERASEMAAAAAEYQYEETLAEEAEKAAAEKITASPSASVSASTGISIKEAAVPAEIRAMDQPRADEEFDIPLMNYEPEAAVGGPAGLYSPASGLGWESYLKDRLDSELSRSASFEQDLSLLVLAYDDLTSQDANYAAIGAAIEKFFSFRDLAFERGDDGFSVILPNIDVGHALRMAQEFYKKLVFLAEGDFAELELSPLFMGISSRSGRLVDAGRLIEEADAAIEKARYEKDSRIVAFKPDPDKYRLFLASKGA